MLLPHANCTELGQSAAELWPKTIFIMVAIHHLEFSKFSNLVNDCHQVPSLLLFTKFRQNWMIVLYGIAI